MKTESRSNNYFNHSTDSRMRASLKEQQLDIEGVRGISAITLPSNWTWRPYQPTHVELIQRFGPEDDMQTNLLFFGLKNELPQAERESFYALLTGTPHPLTPNEVEQNYAVLRYRSDVLDFRLDEAAIGLWNGMPVLQASGEWLKSRRRVLSLIAGGDARCRWFQEITYTAIGTHFDECLPDALASLGTILWRQECKPGYEKLGEQPS